ncbi:MAG TPA: HD domain-containing protein [Pseudonocardiaceae bacterium]|jgi:(p)ppGpp synthase/HD superfamily hydrolase|nr:HD domain-containing protein [Pseudonocardiaceae bacterium]
MGGNQQIRTQFGVAHAVAIAREAHEGQVDKAGRPYIDHPLRVMAGVSGAEEQMAAVLHDVIEDTSVTADDLVASGCPPQVVSAVIALSKLPGEQPEHYLRRVATDRLALAVKRADIADNTNPARLSLLEPSVRDRLRAKYAKASRLLDEYERELAME